MPAKKKPSGTDADLNLATLAAVFTDEAKAVEFFEAKRWPDGPVCPHCGGRESYKIASKPETKRKVRPGLRKCKACRKPFTVKMGTVFEESNVPLSKWLMAIHLLTSSKKGMSSRQIARELGVTVKTAWFLTHRIREAMREDGTLDMMSGAVEVDETYVGGKPRYRGAEQAREGHAKKAGDGPRRARRAGEGRGGGKS